MRVLLMGGLLLGLLALPAASTAAQPGAGEGSPCPPVTAAPFADVPASSTHAPGIVCAVHLGIASGTGGGRFHAGSPVRRDQAASVLAGTLRAVTGSAESEAATPFGDLAGNVHAEAVALLAERGVVSGVGTDRYGPRRYVTRAQFASMVVALHRVVAGEPLAASAGSSFRDLGGSVHAPAIAAATAAGLVSGTSATTFAPDAPISRGQVASLAVRLAESLWGEGSDGTAAGGGPWSDPATWGGQLPRAGEPVSIPAGTSVVLDTTPPPLGNVTVDGTLTVAPGDHTLHARSVMVHGHFAVGAPGRPHDGRFVLVLDPEPGQQSMGEGALMAMGGVVDLHGARRSTSWTRLSAPASAGSSTIRVQAHRGWRVGDRIVIASSEVDAHEAEERTITAVGAGTIRLDRPLEHGHRSHVESIGGGTVEQRAEVGLLTRDIVVRSADRHAGTGFGGHVLVMAGSTARIADAEFAGLGQTGVIGRYAIHFHVAGDVGTSYVRSSAIHHANSRCLTIHGTHNLLVEDNVAYDNLGHCYFFEDAVETGNRLVGNLGLLTRVPEPGDRLLETDATPATYWITNPANTFIGNVAAGSEGDGFWFDLPSRPTGLHEGHDVRPRKLPLGTFRGNVAHSNDAGQFRHGSGLLIEDHHPSAASVYEDFTAWENGGFGIWAEHGVEVEGAVLSDNEVGFLGRDSVLRDSLIVGRTGADDDPFWSTVGVGMYHEAFDVERVTFANFRPPRWGHSVAIGSIVDHSSGLPTFRDVDFVDAERVRVPAPWHADDPQPAVAFRDLDGSVTGAASTVVADNPLLLTDDCAPEPALAGHRCPAGMELSYLKVQDATGSTAPIGPTQVTRSDGARHLAFSDPDWASYPFSQTAGVMDRAYAFDTTREPTQLEVVAAGYAAGWVEVGVPWPHDELHVHRGWGAWAEIVRPAASRADLADGGYWLDRGSRTLWVRFEKDAGWQWQRHMICPEFGCGEGLSSRR